MAEKAADAAAGDPQAEQVHKVGFHFLAVGLDLWVEADGEGCSEQRQQCEK
jgi:hypothetical protein